MYQFSSCYIMVTALSQYTWYVLIARLLWNVRYTKCITNDFLSMYHILMVLAICCQQFGDYMSVEYVCWYWICWNVAKCVHEGGRNQTTPFWIQVMFSVFRGHKYDDIRPNHTKKSKNAQKTPKIAKTQKKHKIALHSTAMHSSETPQLLTPDGSDMTQNDPGWLTMAQDDIPGVRGAPRGSREAPGGTRGCRGALSYFWGQKEW